MSRSSRQWNDYRAHIKLLEGDLNECHKWYGVALIRLKFLLEHRPGSVTDVMTPIEGVYIRVDTKPNRVHIIAQTGAIVPGVEDYTGVAGPLYDDNNYQASPNKQLFKKPTATPSTTVSMNAAAAGFDYSAPGDSCYHPSGKVVNWVGRRLYAEDQLYILALNQVISDVSIIELTPEQQAAHSASSKFVIAITYVETYTTTVIVSTAFVEYPSTSGFQNLGVEIVYSGARTSLTKVLATAVTRTSHYLIYSVYENATVDAAPTQIIKRRSLSPTSLVFISDTTVRDGAVQSFQTTKSYSEAPYPSNPFVIIGTASWSFSASSGAEPVVSICVEDDTVVGVSCGVAASGTYNATGPTATINIPSSSTSTLNTSYAYRVVEITTAVTNSAIPTVSLDSTSSSSYSTDGSNTAGGSTSRDEELVVGVRYSLKHAVLAILYERNTDSSVSSYDWSVDEDMHFSNTDASVGAMAVKFGASSIVKAPIATVFSETSSRPVQVSDINPGVDASNNTTYVVPSNVAYRTPSAIGNKVGMFTMDLAGVSYTLEPTHPYTLMLDLKTGGFEESPVNFVGLTGSQGYAGCVILKKV